MKIFQNSPVLDGNERKYVLDCLDTNWISGGKYVTDLERYFSRYCNASYGVACSNGTASLHLALEALGIGPGDEVIVPCFTLVADANMVILAGAKPVFADVDAHTWCIEPDQIRSKITERTKAIICVHMYGHPCDMDGIAAIAKEHGLFVIEDAAQAHGTEYRGRMSGGLGDVACFSFYASKTLTSGEGGLLVTNDHTIAERAKIIRNQGFEGDGRTYVHRLMGFNYRLTNIQAAIALAQCERVREKVERKRQIRQQYEALLGKERGISFQREEQWARSSYWNTVILIEEDFGKSRDEVVAELARRDVETRLCFKALHQQPLYAGRDDPRYPDVGGRYPVSEMLSSKGVCLPSGVGLRNEEIEAVAERLLECRG